MKYIITIALLFFAMILGVVIKPLYDTYANSTGIFVISGVSDNDRALFYALPWIIPLMIFIIVVIMLVRSRKEQ